jgi:electron transport complex protein RnfG
MRESIKLPLTLTLIAVAAGLILGITNYLTKEPIKMQHELALKSAREELFSSCEFTELTDINLPEGNENVHTVYEAFKGNELQGHIITLDKTGYGGAIIINVGVTKEGVITGVIVGSNSETPGLGAKASDEKFSGQFENKKSVKLVKGQATGEDEISARSAATITSQALVDGANQAIEVSRTLMESKNG